MPELPEVQTIVSDLQEIVGDRFIDFFSVAPKAVKNISLFDFVKEITGQKIKSVSRLGKIILIRLISDKTIAIHLKMTGKLILAERGTWNVEHEKDTITKIQATKKNSRLMNREPKTGKLPKHLHHIFFLKKNALKFYDVRKFATISLLDDRDLAKIKEKYGIDPMTDNFSLKEFSGLLRKGKSRKIKEALMNNSLILGIGNIYASEILFDAHILPSRKTDSLSENEIKNLRKSVKKILTKAIKLRGTSISDYRDARDKSGSFQDHLYVYKRNGQKCKKCGTIILRSVIAQRSAFYCPNCQK